MGGMTSKLALKRSGWPSLISRSVTRGWETGSSFCFSTSSRKNRGTSCSITSLRNSSAKRWRMTVAKDPKDTDDKNSAPKRFHQRWFWLVVRSEKILCMSTALVQLNRELIGCTRCSRLVEYCQKIGREKRRAYRACDYWAKPV